MPKAPDVATPPPRQSILDGRHAADNSEVAELPGRERSRFMGLTQYHGKSCRACGGTLRWVASCACVDCQRRWQAGKPRNYRAKSRDISALMGSWSR